MYVEREKKWSEMLGANRASDKYFISSLPVSSSFFFTRQGDAIIKQFCEELAEDEDVLEACTPLVLRYIGI